MSSTERSSGLNDVLNPQWLRRTHAQTPGAHLQIVWRGHFSLGNTREEEEGPTTSTLRADSAVSDGQVSVGEETCGSDATQVQQEANSSMRALSSERVRRGASVVAVCAGVGEDRDVVVEQLDDEQSMNSDEEMRREEEQQTESEIWTTSERSYRSFEERRRERVENTNGVAFDVMNQSNLRGEIGRAEIGGTAARAQARDLNATAREYEAVGREFNLNATELIARAPPMGFRITGRVESETSDEFGCRVSSVLGSSGFIVFISRKRKISRGVFKTCAELESEERGNARRCSGDRERYWRNERVE
jgi:hypothetical protein